MLTLKNIRKTYVTGDSSVEALKGVSVSFRKNEFVAVLGPSGCGKTTMLNIIGGLDNYTDGDLFIGGVSTKEYTDADWDSYRNHSIGFVFQSYNLIPHQSVLSNVELALTLSGVPKAERRERARRMLEKVGLGDQLSKKPNQMSGGQMQRVAIARALVNDPQILLADEPTGALDTETGIQLMEVLKEIAKDRLVIMVTHNPELAEKYATRTVRLLDGNIIDDTAPYDAEAELKAEEKAAEKADRKARREKKKHAKARSMSFRTALSLSLNNLFTKRARTILTSFAGSIGIIGISLILSMSTGATNYINRVEKDTLSSYPITIEKSSVDVASMLEDMSGKSNVDEDRPLDRVYSSDIMTDMMKTMISEVTTNDLESFKSFLDKGGNGISELTSDIKYSYDITLNLYQTDGEKPLRVNPSTAFDFMGVGTKRASGGGMFSAGLSNSNVWKELIGNRAMLEDQYEVLEGTLPNAYNEAVIIVDRYNRLSDYTLYTLGLKDPAELEQMFKAMTGNGEMPETKSCEYAYGDLIGLSYKLMLNSDYYSKLGDTWVDCSDDEDYVAERLKEAEEITIVGVLRPAENAVVTSAAGGTVGYTAELTRHLIDKVNESEIVKAQRAAPETNILTGRPFATEGGDPMALLTDAEKAQLAQLPQEQQAAALSALTASADKDATFESVMKRIGGVDIASPSRINIYPKDFESKDFIEEKIQQYNDDMGEGYTIRYTDYIGLLLTSVTTIINAISYILIAFVSVSLVVSSIMIGIITYISVLERTKEIGILRSIGASKKDISRVFNAETLIVGFGAGAMGILVTLLLLIPANLILKSLTDIAHLAVLPLGGAVALVIISMLLTLIAGIIPSRIAAKRDPVEALRSE